ncbi:MAG: PDZ domain-containing protein [Candidatus Omnitrophota bacterium]|nr:MAG: PDZ domain-containing protein [Candidatus Omnitrophota bacterium]
MHRLTVAYLFFHWIFLCRAFVALADTVYLNDGTEIMGIIVENYKDRIVISTYEGEKTFVKKNISKISYDLTEQNLVELGDRHMSRRELIKAYFYYEKAHKLNPEYKEASDKMNYVLGYLFREQDEVKRREIEKRREIKDWQGSASLADKDSKNRLEKDIGIRIAEEAGSIRIKEILKNSPASRAGLKKNDTLVSVWGRFTGYMPEDEIARILLEESPGEIKLCIRRDIILKKSQPRGRDYRDIIGGKLDMLTDGLTIVTLESGRAGQKAGLAKDDVIVAINGATTRYMPFKDATGIIENNSKGALIFSVRRDLTVWKGK